jgi:hypothetical protein
MRMEIAWVVDRSPESARGSRESVTAAGGPSPRQLIQMFPERFETREVVHREEVIDERKRRLHPAREGLILMGAQQRIEPNEPMSAPLQACDLLSEHVGIAPIPSI